MNQITFTDFLKSLITETIVAVSETQYQQENKIIELKEDLLATDEQLIRKYHLIEEAKKDLEASGETEKPEDIIKIKINSLRQVLSTYFENGYVKPIIDEGKISAKFIYNMNANTVEKSSELHTKKQASQFLKKSQKKWISLISGPFKNSNLTLRKFLNMMIKR